MARPSSSTSFLPPRGSSALVATLWVAMVRFPFSVFRFRGLLGGRGPVLVDETWLMTRPCDRGPGHVGFDPAEHAAEPAHAEHPQDLGQAAPLDQVVGHP